MTRGAPGTPGRMVEYFDVLRAGEVVGTANVTSQLSADSAETFQVLLRANPDNTGRVRVGNNLAQTLPLDAGDSVIIPIDDLRKIYVWFETTNDTVAWLAMG